MLKKAILGWNAAPGAPAGWDPTLHGECGALPIRVHPPESVKGQAAVDYCESAWEPTPVELEMLNRGGQVVLRVAGWQVPVMLNVEPPRAGLEAQSLVAALEERLTQCRTLLAYALNAVNGTEFFNVPSSTDAKGWAAMITARAIETEFVVFDDLHHAPRCPANHFHKTRMPTGLCRCGAQRDADEQAKEA